jgi:hypothetical protein
MGSRINFPDLAFGVLLIAIGLVAWILIADLPVGTATSMGPGYVPRGLALLIGAFGVVQCARAFAAARVPLPSTALRPLLLVGASVAVFALLLRTAGLALTAAAVVIVAGFAAYDVRLRENLLLAVGLAVFAVLLFVMGLGLPIPIWPQ